MMVVILVSHMTEVETLVKDLTCLKETLEELGYAFSEAAAGQKVWVRGWNGAREAADLVINTKSSYDIGLRLKLDGTYEFLADWWGVESHAGFTQTEFTQKVLQTYSYHKVITEAKSHGFSLVSETRTADQAINVVMRKWV